MEFAAFSLPEPLLTNLAGLGFSKATQVQAEAIPLVLAGSDLLVQAQTGTGKTAAFALPLLARLLPATTERAVKPAAPKALVLVPTRELAQQVFDNIKSYAKGCELKIAIAYGGVPLDGQLKNFRMASISWSPRPGACWITLKSAVSGWIRLRPWCLMRPTACWIWGLKMRSRR